jgi:hypothetical protein
MSFIDRFSEPFSQNLFSITTPISFVVLMGRKCQLAVQLPDSQMTDANSKASFLRSHKTENKTFKTRNVQNPDQGRN